jgi:hypothetical protein
VLYISYEVVRALAPAREAVANANANAILAVERFLHLDIELTLNRALTAVPTLANAASVYYQYAHESVALIVLILMWRYRRRQYAALRNTLVVVTLVSVVVYWILPVAPPRMALAGTVDTISTSSTVLLDSSTVTGLANLYAAMPSLHVAWAVWCALAVIVTTTSRWRHLAWLYPLITTLVVLATANHYLLDTVAGAAVTAGVWWATTSFSRARIARSATRCDAVGKPSELPAKGHVPG